MALVTPPLEFKACAGFANRLRALVSAMCAAEDIVPLNSDGSRPISLIVSWTPETNIHTAPFDLLFDRSSLPSWVVFEDSRVQPHSGWEKTIQVLSQDEWDFTLLQAGQKRPIRIKSHGQFHRSDPDRWLYHLRTLKPALMIQCVSDDIFASIPNGANIIGIHIRRGDNEKSIVESPSELFWNAMNEYDSNTLFYLATDSIEERIEVTARFPGRVFLGSDTIIGRNDPFGCREALIDFYCLSRCSEILGSYYSSFSEMASMYGDVPLRVLRL
jgi:hypothetical protein